MAKGPVRQDCLRPPLCPDGNNAPSMQRLFDGFRDLRDAVSDLCFVKMRVAENDLAIASSQAFGEENRAIVERMKTDTHGSHGTAQLNSRARRFGKRPKHMGPPFRATCHGLAKMGAEGCKNGIATAHVRLPDALQLCCEASRLDELREGRLLEPRRPLSINPFKVVAA